MSSVLTSTMKNTSSSGITCMRRSRAAGKSVPPSFCQAIWGEGWPTAAHSSLAVAPARILRSIGILVKEGSTGNDKKTLNLCHWRLWQAAYGSRHIPNNWLIPSQTYCWQWAWPWWNRMIQSGWRWRTGTFPHWKTPHYAAAGWSYTPSPPSRLLRRPAHAGGPGCGSPRRSGPRCLSSRRRS